MCNLFLRSPAKINLFFRILGRYKSGFHEVATLCHVIDLFDEIYISFSKQDTFSVSDPSLDNQSNLVIQARDLFRSRVPSGGRSLSIS